MQTMHNNYNDRLIIHSARTRHQSAYLSQQGRFFKQDSNSPEYAEYVLCFTNMKAHLPVATFTGHGSGATLHVRSENKREILHSQSKLVPSECIAEVQYLLTHLAVLKLCTSGNASYLYSGGFWFQSQPGQGYQEIFVVFPSPSTQLSGLKLKTKLNSGASIRERTMPTERPSLVGGGK
jgi:hypothetical protein